MPTTRWYDKFESAQSDGTLPNQKTARAFRYCKSLIWEIDLLSLGISGVTKRFEWTMQFANSDGSQLFFKQTVGLVLFLVSLGAAGLQLFTWNYVRDEFDTSMVAGVPVTKDTIGAFLLGGTALSEQGDLQPASGQDSTDLTATIITDWYSPIYEFHSPGRALPVGYRFTKSHDTGGIGNLQSTYGFAFEEEAAQPVATSFDGLGALLTGRPATDGASIVTARAWPGNHFGFLEDGGAVAGQFPTLCELSDGRELLTLQTDEGVVEVISHNSEWSWKRMKYPGEAGAGAAPTPAVLFGPEVSMPISLHLDDDSRLVIAQDGAHLTSVWVTGEGVGEQIAVGASDADVIHSLERAGDGTILIIGKDGVPVFESKSLPPRWQPLPPPTGGAA